MGSCGLTVTSAVFGRNVTDKLIEPVLHWIYIMLSSFKLSGSSNISIVSVTGAIITV